MEKSFYIWRHQGKELAFNNALESAGFVSVQPSCARVLLTDVDIPGRVVRVEKQLQSGRALMFVYPHAARPFIGWDGLFQPYGYTAGVFVFADGHKDVLLQYGYDRPIHTVGWVYSPIIEFKPRTLKKILFAPIHPNANGWLSLLDQKINREAMDKVAKVAKDTGAEVTVRHIKSLFANGIQPADGMKYCEVGAELTNFEVELSQYNLIISHQTLAFISVALGIPTLMMAEYEAPRNGNTEEKFKRVKSWDKYKHLMMYPLDILDTDNATDLALRACAYEGDNVADWKLRLIGTEAFSAQKVVDVVQSYL